ncbi:MAG: AmmeMemoRadiSam system radical SAM enzyme [Candidatus Zixiibacteriota bacterium]|nr:MAG: AmmeMemoRadiSam system radical SAM enzyme [candidate division Zixibacteria bacterium]
MIKTAAYYDAVGDATVICRLCPARCRLKDGQKGICDNRFNRGGVLVTDNYGELVTLAIDPIEKKPLYHFFPSRDILSTGANGCNLNCVHCQNWTISQQRVRTMYVPPEKLAEMAGQHDSIGVAFTYTEPFIWYEYIMDVAPLLREKGLKVVLVTNGYINQEPLVPLMKFVDAANVDLKGMRPEFYKKMCKGRVEPVLDAISALAREGVHLEITNLVIPGKNDSDRDLEDLTDFVASLSDCTPLHFSAYHPDYKLTIPPTPVSTMIRARDIGKRKLKYVYIGNIFVEGGSDTLCPACGHLLVRRNHFFTSLKGLSGSKCSNCDFETGIIQ